MKYAHEDSQFLYHTSCDHCGSSDANAIYDNNTSYCFSCEKWDKVEEEEQMFNNLKDIGWIDNLPIRGFKERKVNRDTTTFYGVKVKQDLDENITHHYYPYTSNGELVGYKERDVETKSFKYLGEKSTDLFGQSKFQSSAKRLIITEGEIDAMTVYQLIQKAYPGMGVAVVSIPNGAQARKSLLHNRDWIRSFKDIVLMFDNDHVGKEAVEKAARIIGVDRVKVAELRDKDPNESFLNRGPNDVLNQVFEAKQWAPPGIVSSVDQFKEQYFRERDSVYIPYPDFVEELNDKIYGRRLGSITMFTSGTGCGKTTFLREDSYHIWKTTEDMIGICSLEESIAETVRGFISLHMNTRLGIPEAESSVEKETEAIDTLFGDERFMLLDHQGSLVDDSIVDKIEFMAASGCQFIYLDHITIAVSEEDGGSNKSIDKLMSDLLKIAKRFNVWIGVVSHLRKTGNSQRSFEEGGNISMDDLKGSGSLKQISAQIISLSRNLNSEDENERHMINLSVLKDRFSGNTGPTCHYKFKRNGRLEKCLKPGVSGFDNLTEGET